MTRTSEDGRVTRAAILLACLLALAVAAVLTQLPNAEPALPNCPRDRVAHVRCAP